MPTLLAAVGLIASAAAADTVWSGLADGLWRVRSGATAGSALTLEDLPEGGDHGAPSLSPDGSRVAIEVTGAGVWVCSLAGGTCERLLGLPGVAARPTWNRQTGELIFAVFSFEGGEEDSDLWVVDASLENPRPLVVQTGNQDDPDVSPDGRTLVYSSIQKVLLHRANTRIVSHLWMMDLVTGRARPLAPGAFQDVHPDWSPDGKKIAFASNRSGQFEIWVGDAEGGELRQLTSGEGSKSWPAWSPEGQSLLFARLLDGRFGLMEVGVETGSEPKPFTLPGLEADAQMRDPDWR